MPPTSTNLLELVFVTETGQHLRIDNAELAVVYCYDHEPFSRAIADGHGKFWGLDQRHADFIEGADLLIHEPPRSIPPS
jgi:hypothetical protein